MIPVQWPETVQLTTCSSAAVPKTREGYYHYTGGVEAAIKRELAFAPYADMIWLETKLPDLAQARYFARKIREEYPGKCVLRSSATHRDRWG